MPNRHARWAATCVAAVGALLLVAALPAAAHVSVSSPDAAPGGFGKIVFRVPTESESASTTKVEVTLPMDTPFAFVSTKPLPGWTVEATERTLDEPMEVHGSTLTKAVATVTWTAVGKDVGIKPGEFDEFELSAGPFPEDVAELAMPATQTYSDGAVVKWDEVVAAGAEEPEHPAPTLSLAAAEATGATETVAQAESTEAAAATGDSSDAPARWLAGAAVLLAAAALLVALLGMRRRSA